MKFKLALVQFEVSHWNPETNLKRMEEFMERAKSGGAQVVVFPEDCVTGQMLRNQEMLSRDGRYSKIFAQLASRHQIDLVPGSWMEEDPTDRKWYNTTCYFDSSGRALQQYRKINLWGAERTYITPGNKVQVFDTKYGKAALTICWDLISPELFRELRQQGVQIVYCPSDWSQNLTGYSDYPDSERRHVNALCVTRALENGLILAYCNLAGTHTHEDFPDPLIGQTQITTPLHCQLAHVTDNTEQLLVAEVDTEVLKEAERRYFGKW